jgi:hypothetical protein
MKQISQGLLGPDYFTLKQESGNFEPTNPDAPPPRLRRDKLRKHDAKNKLARHLSRRKLQEKFMKIIGLVNMP